MSRQRIKSLRIIGIAIASTPLVTRACDYHWALGIPEPTVVFAPAAPSSLSAGDAAANELLAADTVNDAAITSWMRNTTGKVGSSTDATINNLVNKIAADVQLVEFNNANVYVHATGVPSHSVGPFTANPAAPSDRNRWVEIPRNPQINNNTKTAVGLGVVGVMVNGVAFFDPRDAATYNNQGVWHQNANKFEAASFDGGPGHPVPDMNSQTTPKTGNYHYHQSPTALINQLDPGNTGQHASPLIGFAFDGFPIYGPYDYTNTDGTGPITRMKSGYQLRNISARTTLADGTSVTAGPTVASVALGSYVEDFAYASAVNDPAQLDQYNGRFEINADYPQGSYCYHVTLDASLAPAYPYIIGPNYYGIVDSNNLQGGVITVPGSGLTVYNGVPEPSTMALLVAGGAMLLRRRSRK